MRGGAEMQGQARAAAAAALLSGQRAAGSGQRAEGTGITDRG